MLQMFLFLQQLQFSAEKVNFASLPFQDVAILSIVASILAKSNED